MPNDTTPTAPPNLFNTREALTRAMSDTKTWQALNDAVNAAPRIKASSRRGSLAVAAGLNFEEVTPHINEARTGGSLIITADGSLTVRAHTIPRLRWMTALTHLCTLHPSLKGLNPSMPTDRAPGIPGTPDQPVHGRTRLRTCALRLQKAGPAQATAVLDGVQRPQRNGKFWPHPPNGRPTVHPRP